MKVLSSYTLKPKMWQLHIFTKNSCWLFTNMWSSISGLQEAGSPAGASRNGRWRSWQLSMVIRILWREGCFPELKFLHTCLLESQIWDSKQGAKVKYFSDQWSESMMWSWEKISQSTVLENPSGMVKTCALLSSPIFSFNLLLNHARAKSIISFNTPGSFQVKIYCDYPSMG